ncbi:MAG TPA: cyclase family protein [Firmicutes bacterium]|nr:cyclase family protein [Bacillota bacterium]
MPQRFLDRYRVVDLSVLCVPGEESRRLALRRGVIEWDGTTMYEIDTMSHIGTHVEAPSHFYDDGKDVVQLPLSAFFGDAVLIDVKIQQAGQLMDRAFFEARGEGLVQEDDILLLTNSSAQYADRPHKPALTTEAARWMVEKGIKMLGFDTSIALGRSREDARAIHDILMSRDITLLEVLGGLDQLRKSRFIFFALPLKIKGLDSSPVRAMALEEKD